MDTDFKVCPPRRPNLHPKDSLLSRASLTFEETAKFTTSVSLTMLLYFIAHFCVDLRYLFEIYGGVLPVN